MMFSTFSYAHCLFTYLFLQNVCSHLLPILFNWVVFLFLVHKRSLFILETSPFRYMSCEYFLPVCDLNFIFLISFKEQKFLILMMTNSSIFFSLGL